MVRFYYSDAMMGYNMGPHHPMRPIRLKRTVQLLDALGLPGKVLEIVAPELADPEEVAEVHDRGFVEALAALDRGENVRGLHRYGLGTGDNPLFEGIGAASMRYAGASIQAAQDVINAHNGGTPPVAFNIAGGLHHAHFSSAAGFCVLNDCALAINRLRRQFKRVAYVDIDVHHGDGVQELFYTDPSVLTLSIHEFAHHFFPGTGDVTEIGSGDGEGASVNIPVAPYTGDDAWIMAWREAALPILKAFKPEAIVLQLGADPHALDPLAHACLTAQGWLTAVQDIAALGLPTVAVGGGGYCLTTVSRMWALAVGVLTGTSLPDAVPETCPLASEMPFLLDHEEPDVPDYLTEEADAYATQTVELVRNRFSEFYRL